MDIKQVTDFVNNNSFYAQTTYQPESGDVIPIHISVRVGVEQYGDELSWEYWIGDVWPEFFTQHPDIPLSDQNKIMALFQTGTVLNGWTQLPNENEPLIPSLQGSGEDPNDFSEYFLQD